MTREPPLDPPTPRDEALDQERKARDADRWYEDRTERYNATQASIGEVERLGWTDERKQLKATLKHLRKFEAKSRKVNLMVGDRIAAQEMLAEMERTRNDED